MIFRSSWPDIELPTGTICDAIWSSARLFEDKAAVIQGEDGQVLTYGQLIAGADRVAAGLSCAGLQPRQPLALALPNCIDFVLAWYGALRAGAWVVPINPVYTTAEMELQIRDSGARYVVTVPEHAAALESSVDHLFVVDGNWKQVLECDAPPPDVRPSTDDLAVLPYSSGTTGKPKGVMLTHFNVVTMMWQLYATDWARREDVVVNMFPLFHAAGLNCVLNPLLGIGATVVLMRRFELEAWLALNERYRANWMAVPPPVVVSVTKSHLWNQFRLDSIRHVVCGAAPLGAELQEAFEQRTGVVLAQGWGMSETTAGVAGSPHDRTRRKLGSCGNLLPCGEAKVVDVATQEELGIGEAGEIWLRGPHMMKGYWNQPDVTAQTFAGNGWMRTGDIGYFDSDGCVFLVDRLKELIKYNAYQVAPAELEDIIQSHPAVLDAAVIGAPDEGTGEIPVAFVVRKEGGVVGAEELMQFVAARVAPYKKVRAVEFIDQIPKSPAGKILRRLLKERARAQHAKN